MSDASRMTLLKAALVVFGLIFIGGIYLLMVIWPSGWTWTPRQSEYEQMIIGIYAVLGLFLVRAAMNPLKHASLIWFTIWSSAVHGAIMLVQALVDPMEKGHLLGDVPALFIVAIVLAVLMPRRARTL